MKEELSKLCHEQWSNWMKYLFSKCKDEWHPIYRFKTGNLIIPKEFVDRWTRQMNTEYKDLSEEEKESDRKEADKFLTIINMKRR